MKIKFRLSLLVIIIMTIVVTGIATLLLRRASYISLNLNMKGVEFLAGQRAEFWKGWEDGYVRVLHTLADVMSDYETLPKGERRNRYDEMLKSSLESEHSIVSLYMVWKPNAIDGIDERYIGRVGSSPTGQYAIAYTRETGKITAHTSNDIENMMVHISGPNARRDRVGNPLSQTVNGKETMTFIISVPIINGRNNDVVGGVGCVLNIDMIQPIIEDTIKTNDIIDIAVLYSSNGTILAHFKPECVGKKMFDVDVELGDSIPVVFAALQNGTTFRETKYDPVIGENIGFVMKPFQIGNSDHNMAVLIGASESYIFKEIRAITKFTIVLAVIALVLSAFIVYFAFNRVTKPIARAAETLKDISEGEGDLTRTITEHGSDEIADLARYYNKTLEKIKRLIVTIKGRTVALSGIGGDHAWNMTGTVATVNEKTISQQAENIRIVTEEQEQGSKQIMASLVHLNEITGKNRENIDILAREDIWFKVA